MTRELTAQSCALMLSSARTEAGVTQRQMAQAVGVGERTIKNWEAGTSCPDLIQLLTWFRACGLNPVRYILTWINPDTFYGLSAENSTEDVKTALSTYINDVATDTEIRELSYCIFGNHGSSWQSQLEMLCAHDHTTMRSRVTVARAILENYEMEDAQGLLVGTDHILPDIDHLREAVEKGKVAAQAGQSGYVGI